MINTIERMGGAVSIDCAANCLQAWQQNDNGWDQGQLFYTQTGWWGMPPYHAQQMIARHYQPLWVQAMVDGADDALDVTATRSEDGHTVVVKVVNLEGQDQAAMIALEFGRRVGGGRMRTACLTGPLDAVNSPEEPRKIVPVESERLWDGGPVEHIFPGYSFSILQFDLAEAG
jgi:alpha-L-arabinofuranosidase